MPAALPPLYGDLRHWGLIEADALALLGQLPDQLGRRGRDRPALRLGVQRRALGRRQPGRRPRLPGLHQLVGAQLLRVLKPGAHLAAFGAPRTVHRLVAGFEDAGLEVRDQLLWCFGSGVPKSRRMPGGLGSASSRPTSRSCWHASRSIARRRPSLANVARHGTGALNIDAARIPQTRHRVGRRGLLASSPRARP